MRRSKKKCSFILATPKIKKVLTANTIKGTTIDGGETLMMSAETAKSPLLMGLHFAKAFVYADRSIWA
jgi:hypothetical protein